MACVYVSGVKKPYGCTFCPWCRTTYSFCKAANKNISVLEMNKGPDWCPLVEVPDHGDLIDRDEVAHEIWYAHCYECKPDEIEKHCESCVVKVIIDSIVGFPAVIPADKEEVDE